MEIYAQRRGKSGPAITEHLRDERPSQLTHVYRIFVRPTITSEKVRVGEYTYYDDSADTGSFEDERVLYGYGAELLVIGKFCSIAAGVRFVIAVANPLNSGPSTFPFTIFSGRWQDETLQTFQARATSKGDTVVGNDVWLAAT